MTYSRNTVIKGSGAVAIRQISTGRLLYLNTNSKVSFTKATTEGDKVQGFNSTGALVDLDVAGDETTYELEVLSKKQTRNINELILNAEYVAKGSYQVPWAETATIASGSVTLTNGTPVSSSIYVSTLDGSTVFASTGSAPSAGQFKDNGDGTLTFNTGDNGKQVVIWYKTSQSNIFVQGGADFASLGYVDIIMHMVSGTSSVNGKKGVDLLWLPKCSISGEATFEFSNEVNEKGFKATAVIPDTPSGFLVPYAWMRDMELVNTNAG